MLCQSVSLSRPYSWKSWLTGIFPASTFKGSRLETTSRSSLANCSMLTWWSGRHRVDPIAVARTIWLNSLVHHDRIYSPYYSHRSSSASAAIALEHPVWCSPYNILSTHYQQLQHTLCETKVWWVSHRKKVCGSTSWKAHAKTSKHVKMAPTQTSIELKPHSPVSDLVWSGLGFSNATKSN